MNILKRLQTLAAGLLGTARWFAAAGVLHASESLRRAAGNLLAVRCLSVH